MITIYYHKAFENEKSIEIANKYQALNFINYLFMSGCFVSWCCDDSLDNEFLWENFKR